MERLDVAKLTSKQREKLPAENSVCLKRRAPAMRRRNRQLPDAGRGHAVGARGVSRQQHDDGNLTKDEFERINRKADKILTAKSED